MKKLLLIEIDNDKTKETAAILGDFHNHGYEFIRADKVQPFKILKNIMRDSAEEYWEIRHLDEAILARPDVPDSIGDYVAMTLDSAPFINEFAFNSMWYFAEE